jgi:hypothetical protein
VARDEDDEIEISDEAELLRQFWAVRDRILPSREALACMSEEEVFACLSDLWMGLVQAGFVVPAEREGEIGWDDTKKGDRLFALLEKLGAVEAPADVPE